MHRYLEALLAFPRRLLAEAAALGEIAADVARYASARLRGRYLGQPSGVDPLDAVLNQLVLDGSHSLLEAKKGLAVAIAEGHRLRKQLEHEQASATEWGRRAALADGAGDDVLTREARSREQEHAATARLLDGLWTQHQAELDGLKVMLRAFHERIEHAKRARDRILVARRSVSGRDDARGRFRRMDDAVRVLDGLLEVVARVEPTSAPTEREGPLH
jgi:phage shock protein A